MGGFGRLLKHKNEFYITQTQIKQEGVHEKT